MIRDLVKPGDPILSEVMPEFNFKDSTPDEIKSLCDDLVESVQQYKGLGLAANQIGLRKRAFVIIAEGVTPSMLIASASECGRIFANFSITSFERDLICVKSNF